MKRFLLIVLSCLLIFFSACKLNSPASSQNSVQASRGTESSIASAPNATTELVYSETIPDLTAQDAEMIFDCTTEPWKDFYMGSGLFDGRRVFLNKGQNEYYNGQGFGEHRTIADDYYAYDLDSKQMTLLGTMPPNLMSAASSILMQNGDFLYNSQNSVVGEQRKDVREIYRLNVPGQKINILESDQNANTPFVYFSKLSETEYITHTFGPESGNNEDTSGTSISSVTLYDINTGKGTEIIREELDYTPDKQAGIALECVYAVDGLIYAVCFNGEDHSRFVNVYDKKGTLKNTLLFEKDKPNLFDSMTPLSMTVFGDYIYFENWNMEHALYRIDGQILREFIGPEENIIGPTGLDSLYKSEQTPYFYFVHMSTPEGKKIDQYLFALNTETGVITKINVAIDKEYDCISGIKIDGQGNMIIRLITDFLEDIYPKEYYVTADTLKRLLAE